MTDIVKALLTVDLLIEDDNEPYEDEELLRNITQNEPINAWQQIGGDFGDPWLYGGDWFNQDTDEIIHFDGIEYDKDIEYWDIEVPQEVLNKIGPEIEDDNRHNFMRDQKIEAYKLAKATFINNHKPRYFWHTHVYEDDQIFREYREKVANQFGRGEEGLRLFDSMTLAQQLAAIASYVGWGSVADRFEMNYIEAKQKLGQDMI
jgi:hypothetical protein